MAAKFFALLTNQGAAKLSNMAALGEKLEITSLAVGDGGGISPTPNQAQTKLVNEVRRAQLNSLSVDEKNDSQIIAEQIIPESVGGWWIREIGLFDADGILIAVANCPETYKATTEEGSGRTQVIRMMLTVSSTDAVTLKVDPSVVLATRQYVDSAVIEVKTYTDNAMKKHVDAANPHSQYLLIENALKELAEAGLVGDVLKNLGLGTAAKKNAQSNAFDSTLGALMLVGAFGFGGVGADSANTAITNVYTLPIGDKGNPEPYQNYVHINLAGTSFYSSRIALSMNGTDNPRIFIKSRSGATESEWTEVFTSRNPPKSVATLTTARKISVSGDASGYAMFNGGSDAEISVTIADSAKGVIRIREGSVSTIGTSTANFISIDTGLLIRGITFTSGAQSANVRPLQMLIGTQWVTVGLS